MKKLKNDILLTEEQKQFLRTGTMYTSMAYMLMGMCRSISYDIKRATRQGRLRYADRSQNRHSNGEIGCSASKRYCHTRDKAAVQLR
jgi:hypothetical protein